MAESTAALKYDDLMALVAERAGYGYRATEAAGLSADEETEIDLYVQEGLRDIYLSYEWSFLKPVASSVLWATTTGTVVGQGSYASPSTTITATAAKFYPTMIGHSFVFDTSGTGYTIDGYTSSTVITVTGDASAEASGDTFTITADGSYRLPDDFGGLIGDVYFQANDGSYQPLKQTGVAEITELLQLSTSTARPTFCAVEALTVSGTIGQRFNLLAYRIPDSNYTTKYQYQVLADALTTSGYPYGGARHAETIKYACFAAVERGKLKITDGPDQRNYQRLLPLSIRADKNRAGAESLGLLVDARPSRWHRGDHWPQARTVTVGGETFP